MLWNAGLAFIAIGYFVAWRFPASRGAAGILALTVCIVIGYWGSYLNYRATNDGGRAEPSNNETAPGAKGPRHRRGRLAADHRFRGTIIMSIVTMLVAPIDLIRIAVVADDPQILYGTPASGNVESSWGGVGVMGFPLRAGMTASATFRTSYPDLRYLNSSFALDVNGASCIGPYVARYTFVTR
jgi:hypothetical protein